MPVLFTIVARDYALLIGSGSLPNARVAKYGAAVLVFSFEWIDWLGKACFTIKRATSKDKHEPCTRPGRAN